MVTARMSRHAREVFVILLGGVTSHRTADASLDPHDDKAPPMDSSAWVDRIDMDRFGDSAIKGTWCRKQQDGPKGSRGICLAVLETENKNTGTRYGGRRTALHNKMGKKVARI